MTSKAQAIARMGDDRQTATLLAAARHLEAATTDDALDVLDQLDLGKNADLSQTFELQRSMAAVQPAPDSRTDR